MQCYTCRNIASLYSCPYCRRAACTTHTKLFTYNNNRTYMCEECYNIQVANYNAHLTQQQKVQAEYAAAEAKKQAEWATELERRKVDGCTKCEGTGEILGGYGSCYDCKGTGSEAVRMRQVAEVERIIAQREQDWRENSKTCPSCKGKGTHVTTRDTGYDSYVYEDESCGRCEGKGQVWKSSGYSYIR